MVAVVFGARGNLGRHVAAGLLAGGLAAAFGLSALLPASRVAYDAMRIAGAVFLASMGCGRCRGHAARTPASPGRGRRLARRGGGRTGWAW
jgi:threonine/homoserine/homoserine lactone efflux protein